MRHGGNKNFDHMEINPSEHMGIGVDKHEMKFGSMFGLVFHTLFQLIFIALLKFDVGASPN